MSSLPPRKFTNDASSIIAETNRKIHEEEAAAIEIENAAASLRGKNKELDIASKKRQQAQSKLAREMDNAYRTGKSLSSVEKAKDKVFGANYKGHVSAFQQAIGPLDMFSPSNAIYQAAGKKINTPKPSEYVKLAGFFGKTLAKDMRDTLKTTITSRNYNYGKKDSLDYVSDFGGMDRDSWQAIAAAMAMSVGTDLSGLLGTGKYLLKGMKATGDVAKRFGPIAKVSDSIGSKFDLLHNLKKTKSAGEVDDIRRAIATAVHTGNFEPLKKFGVKVADINAKPPGKNKGTSFGKSPLTTTKNGADNKEFLNSLADAEAVARYEAAIAEADEANAALKATIEVNQGKLGELGLTKQDASSRLDTALTEMESLAKKKEIEARKLEKKTSEKTKQIDAQYDSVSRKIEKNRKAQDAATKRDIAKGKAETKLRESAHKTDGQSLVTYIKKRGKIKLGEFSDKTGGQKTFINSGGKRIKDRARENGVIAEVSSANGKFTMDDMAQQFNAEGIINPQNSGPYWTSDSLNEFLKDGDKARKYKISDSGEWGVNSHKTSTEQAEWLMLHSKGQYDELLDNTGKIKDDIIDPIVQSGVNKQAAVRELDRLREDVELLKTVKDAKKKALSSLSKAKKKLDEDYETELGRIFWRHGQKTKKAGSSAASSFTKLPRAQGVSVLEQARTARTSLTKQYQDAVAVMRNEEDILKTSLTDINININKIDEEINDGISKAWASQVDTPIGDIKAGTAQAFYQRTKLTNEGYQNIPGRKQLNNYLFDPDIAPVLQEVFKAKPELGLAQTALEKTTSLYKTANIGWNPAQWATNAVDSHLRNLLTGVSPLHYFKAANTALSGGAKNEKILKAMHESGQYTTGILGDVAHVPGANIGGAVNTGIEISARLPKMISELETNLASGMSEIDAINEAIKTTTLLHGDYTTQMLTEFEKTLSSYVIFYKYYKNIVTMVPHMIGTRGNQMRLNAFGNLMDMTNPDKEHPELKPSWGEDSYLGVRGAGGGALSDVASFMRHDFSRVTFAPLFQIIDELALDYNHYKKIAVSKDTGVGKYPLSDPMIQYGVGYDPVMNQTAHPYAKYGMEKFFGAQINLEQKLNNPKLAPWQSVFPFRAYNQTDEDKRYIKNRTEQEQIDRASDGGIIKKAAESFINHFFNFFASDAGAATIPAVMGSKKLPPAKNQEMATRWVTEGIQTGAFGASVKNGRTPQSDLEMFNTMTKQHFPGAATRLNDERNSIIYNRLSARSSAGFAEAGNAPYVDKERQKLIASIESNLEKATFENADPAVIAVLQKQLSAATAKVSERIITLTLDQVKDLPPTAMNEHNKDYLLSKMHDQYQSWWTHYFSMLEKATPGSEEKIDLKYKHEAESAIKNSIRAGIAVSKEDAAAMKNVAEHAAAAEKVEWRESIERAILVAQRAVIDATLDPIVKIEAQTKNDIAQYKASVAYTQVMKSTNEADKQKMTANISAMEEGGNIRKQGAYNKIATDTANQSIDVYEKRMQAAAAVLKEAFESGTLNVASYFKKQIEAINAKAAADVKAKMEAINVMLPANIDKDQRSQIEGLITSGDFNTLASKRAELAAAGVETDAFFKTVAEIINIISKQAKDVAASAGQKRTLNEQYAIALASLQTQTTDRNTAIANMQLTRGASSYEEQRSAFITGFDSKTGKDRLAHEKALNFDPNADIDKMDPESALAYAENQNALDQEAISREKQKNEELLKLDKEYWAARRQDAMVGVDALSNLATTLFNLSGKQSKEAFAVMKAASIASALVKGYESAVSSFAAGSRLGGPIVGGIFAAISIAATSAQIAAIRAQEMAAGGPVIGGSGNKDDVPIMAMGGEFMMRKKAVDKYGEDFMAALNAGMIDLKDMKNFEIPSVPSRHSLDTGYADGGSISGTAAPFETKIVLENKTNQQMKMSNGGQRFDGKQMVKSIILELADTDPGFSSMFAR